MEPSPIVSADPSWHPLMVEALSDVGLSLQAVCDRVDLDSDTAALVPERFTSLMLVAQVGPTFWERRVFHHLDRANPFEETGCEVVQQWLAADHPGVDHEVLYPGSDSEHLPLGRLAEAAGWGRPSPLGLLINPTHGLWTAHRVVVATSIPAAELAVRHPVAEPSPALAHPCLDCSAPCVEACPASAVDVRDGFDLEACAHYRVSEGSACPSRCLARNACPVAADLAYGPDQMRHHYGAGLASIREWLAAEAG